jgi:hypothetical protein
MTMINEMEECSAGNLPAVTPSADDPIASVVSTMDMPDKEKRNLIFLLYVLAEGLSPTAAAAKIGMHPASGSRLWKELAIQDLKSGRGLVGKFVQRTQDQYRIKNALKLDRISTVEGKVLDLLEKNPELAAKFPSFFRQAKVVGGLMSEPTPIQPTIHIESVAQMMLNVGNVQPMTKEDQ